MQIYNLKKRPLSKIIQMNTIKSRSFIDNRPITSNQSNLMTMINSKPIQRTMQYGNTKSLIGVAGTVHWHYSYDDTNINSLHLTIADKQDYNNRVWASRKGFTPNSRTNGTWTAWQNNHGTTPEWALAITNGRGLESQAEINFHSNTNINTLLENAYPSPAFKSADFPLLSSL